MAVEGLFSDLPPRKTPGTAPTVCAHRARESSVTDRGHLTTFALALGVVGGLAWIGADLLRRVAFTGYGQPGALDYGLTNTLLGGSVILTGLGTAGAVWRIRSSIGLVGSISGWIAVAGCALLAAGSLAEFVFFREDRAATGWFWFLIGLGLAPLGLTGLGLRLARVWVGPRRLVAGWLVASLPLMVVGFLIGLLGASVAVGITAISSVLLWDRSTETATKAAVSEP